ncbi:MAG: GNAT family N-acetyltransferase [Defluviitaleaceae bacterium]|nr:GNAT family N-acetyltransferase [Defluviitaleaceae bacterium]
MISLIDINEGNYLTVANLQIGEDQRGFVAPPGRIMASAYAMRKSNARCWAFGYNGKIVGIGMVKDLTDEPPCYTIEQILVDINYQGKGIGRAALQMILDILAEERRFDAVEVSVKKAALASIALFAGAGFFDTGYTDPATPDALVLRAELNKQK